MVHICFLEDTKLEGGTQIWVIEAARWFLANGLEVSILTPEGGFTATDAATVEGCKLTTYDYTKVEAMDAESQGIWTEALRPCDVCIMTVHPPRNSFHVAALAGKAIAAGGLKTCLLAKTGSIVAEYKREYYMPETSPPIKSRVVTITNFTRNYLVKEYGIPEDKVTLCYQGTDVKRFNSEPERKAEAKKRYPVPEGAFPVFGCVGAYEKRKGQVFLMDAMVKVVAEHPNVFLTLVGKNGRDGDIEGELKKKVEDAGITKNVAFHPFTKEPMYVYEAVDAVVVSSLMEGLPNVLLEGAAMKKALVSTNIAGCPECVKDDVNGWLCDASDVDGLATAMKKVCAAGPDGCAKLGEAGCEMMCRTMDKGTQFGEFKKLFETIAAEG